MNNIFHIGCLHLGHKNMAKWRGFNSSDEHDEHIVSQWNEVVAKRSKVFIHGDITMESSKYYHLLDRLQGYKHVILGNHDRPQDIKELQKHVDKVSGPFKYKGYWLTHIPVHPMEFDYRVRGNIHAHIHEQLLTDGRYFHVDAKHIDYKPVSFDIIQNTFELLK